MVINFEEGIKTGLLTKVVDKNNNLKADLDRLKIHTNKSVLFNSSIIIHLDYLQLAKQL